MNGPRVATLDVSSHLNVSLSKRNKKLSREYSHAQQAPIAPEHLKLSGSLSLTFVHCLFCYKKKGNHYKDAVIASKSAIKL